MTVLLRYYCYYCYYILESDLIFVFVNVISLFYWYSLKKVGKRRKSPVLPKLKIRTRKRSEWCYCQ